MAGRHGWREGRVIAIVAALQAELAAVLDAAREAGGLTRHTVAERR